MEPETRVDATKAALEDIFGSDEEEEVEGVPRRPVESVTEGEERGERGEGHSAAAAAAAAPPSPSAGDEAASAPPQQLLDDFIDDAEADLSLLKEDPDDVIRTEGGFASDASDGAQGTSRPLTEFDRTLRSLQQRRRRQELTPMERERVAARLLKRMRAAVDADIVSMRLGRPALSKLRMLHDAETGLRRKELRAPLVRQGLLGVLRRWLDPLPNGAPPSIDVRSRVLDWLAVFDPRARDDEDDMDEAEDADEAGAKALAVAAGRRSRGASAKEWEMALLASGIGRCVHYYKLYDPDPECQRKADRLVRRWVSLVLRQDTNYSDALRERYQQVATASARVGGRQERNVPAAAAAADSTATGSRPSSLAPPSLPASLSAAVPERVDVTWTRMPVAEELPAVPRAKSARDRHMDRHLKRLREGTTSAGMAAERAVSVSRSSQDPGL
ncbi:hypothetical protein CDCA_CDCA11G3231 [Cyanidium caldarium]|uniref:TFIIS N-terminal domain-containing protein n=1 Tax=Cyanidium caldarium TaxID=2771 RepID=A0AAV9IYN9_CYACA|nr:hypothetical protein CDCA_CDCA11G3231 [Cyanidium caldarium]